MVGRAKPIEGTDLTDTEMRFIDRYMVHLDRMRAYREAGLGNPGHRVSSQALRMWQQPRIQAELTKRRKEAAEANGVTVYRIVAEYMKIAFFNARDLYDDTGRLLPVRELDENDAAAIAEITQDEIIAGDRVIGVTKKIKLSSKLTALNDLAKHLNMFKEVHEITGKDGGPLELLMEQIGIDPKSRIKPK